MSCVMCHVSDVRCQMSGVPCHVSDVRCHMSHVSIFLVKAVELVNGVSVFNWGLPRLVLRRIRFVTTGLAHPELEK